MLLLDFYYFYAAGVLLSQGENPYDPALLRETMLSLGWPPEKWTTLFPYPPFHLWIFVLASLIPFWLAAVLWTACAFTAIVFAIRLLVPMWGLRELLALLAFFPVWKLLFFGQTTWIILAAYLAFLAFEERKRFVWSGVSLGLVLLKPQLCLVTFPLLLFRGEGWVKRMLGCALCLGVGFVISLLMVPDLVPHYLASVAENAKFHAEFHSVSPLSWVRAYLGKGGMLVALVLGVSASLMVVFRASESSRKEQMLRALPLTLLCAPYLWAHDVILLLPHYLMQLQQIRGERKFFAVLLAVVLLQIGGLLLFQEAGLMFLLLVVAFFEIRRARVNSLG